MFCFTKYVNTSLHLLNFVIDRTKFWFISFWTKSCSNNNSTHSHNDSIKWKCVIRITSKCDATKNSFCCSKTDRRFVQRPGVNFINVLRSAFMLIDPESKKNTVKSTVPFYLLSGSAGIKAVCRMLMKLTTGVCFTSIL